MEGRGEQRGHHGEPGHPPSSFLSDGVWRYAQDPGPQRQQQFLTVPYQTRLPIGDWSGLDGSQYDMAEESSREPRPSAMPQQYLNVPRQAEAAYDLGTSIGPQTAASPFITEESISSPTTGAALPNHEEREADWLNLADENYRRLLRETNTNTNRGRMVEAAESLIEMSRLVLGNVESLGLTKDDPGVYEERLKFWKDFNHCWLAFLTRQLQNSRALQGSGQPLTGVQTVLSKDNVKALGDELIGLNDDLKLTGLIDYEMGVWEEEIVNELVQCWDVWGDAESSQQETRTMVQS